jgi:hypothetical protein
MHTYLLLLHENPADSATVSADEMAAIVRRYSDWAADLAARGLLVAGEKLTDDGGRRLRREADRVHATDGPYAEAHDVIGGFFTVRAANDAEAEALAASCPHLRGRNWIEIRRVEAL